MQLLRERSQVAAALVFLVFFSLSLKPYARLLRLPSEDEAPSDLFNSNAKPVNHRPLIGILSQPGDGDGGETMNGNHSRMGAMKVGEVEQYSYIAASYVKWVEMAGARAVPLIYDEPEEELRRKFKAINGLLLPGGGQVLKDSPFFSVAKKVFEWALEANDNGEYFPVWGTCMGFEIISIIVSKDFDILELKKFAAENNPASLQFVAPWAKQRSLFKWLHPDLVEKIERHPLAMENHEDGMTPERFASNKDLADFFHVLTTTADQNGTTYVSTAEARHYPVYVSQWHPEKNAYEWGLSRIPHTANAVALTQAAANFFVNEARKSTHSPASVNELDNMLIYNYKPIFSGKDGKGYFDQSYVFTVPQGR
eukprot:jgi/Mesen1/10837/ME000093S10351